MNWTDYAQAVGSIATAAALVAAVGSVWVAWKSARASAEQAEAYAGAQSAISWREQVLQLHDRGLTPGQIRYIMHLEHGGAGYELWNGRIDDLVHDVPARAVRSATSADADPALHSCDVMPSTRSGCSGPCTQSVRASGAEAFRRRERSG
jgi:hypothetical protein